MRVRLALLVACVLLSVFVRPSRAQESKAGLTAAEIVGSYTYSGRWGGDTPTFAEGGKYSSLGGDCTHEYLFEGSYRIAEGRVLIRIFSARKWPHGRRDTEDEEKIEPPEGEAWGDSEERLLPVRWGERLYLVDDGELLRFCNAVNAGIEPRGGKDDPDYSPFLRGAYFGTFYLRDGDEKKKASGEPQLPEEWRRFLLKRPIKGLLLSVGGGEDEAVVNVGTRAGLRKGMLLFLEGNERDVPPSYYSGMEVLSVADETAVVRGFDHAKVGDKVSTRYTLPRELR
jgi:hypothetical protein